MVRAVIYNYEYNDGALFSTIMAIMNVPDGEFVKAETAAQAEGTELCNTF